MPYVKAKGKRGMIMNNIMSEERILEIADDKLKDYGRKLTNLQGVFYLRLVKYAIANELVTNNGDGLIVFLTDKEMCQEFAQGKTFINDTLNLFANAGLIERRNLTKAEKEKLFGCDNLKKGCGNCKVTKILLNNISE